MTKRRIGIRGIEIGKIVEIALGTTLAYITITCTSISRDKSIKKTLNRYILIEIHLNR